MKKFKIISIIVLSVAAVSIAAVLYTIVDIYSCGRKILTSRVDAAIVLGAAAWGNNPSPVFKERINHAVTLYKKGLCRYIIITGGKGFPDEPGESVIGRKYAEKQGIPESSILIENYSRNTEQNIHYARIIAQQHGLSTFALVSDPFHLRRALLIAEHESMNVYPSATPTSRYRSHDAKVNFLFKEVYYISLYRLQYLTGIKLMQVIDDFTL